MSELDELQKLEELKEQGTITKRDYNKIKKSIVKGDGNANFKRWVRIPVALLVIYLSAHGIIKFWWI